MAEAERIEPDWIWTALDTPEFVALDWIGDPFHPLATLM